MRETLDWHVLAIKLYREGKNATQVHDDLLEKYHIEVNLHSVRSWLKNHKNDTKPELEAALKRCSNNSGKRVEPTKPVVIEDLEPDIYDADWDDNCETITFGLMGDTQMGSKYTQLTHLNNFYDICAKRGIDTIYHTGDITDGLKMRLGHEYELYEVTADEMCADVINNYPHREGIKTYFITGNHDASIYKHVGYDIGNAIANNRPDMIYLGRDCARVNLTPNCTMELRHPWDGTAYALSYKLQKMIEAFESDSKPNILAVGHYHKCEYMFYRNVHAIQTGCFQSQTPFTRGKGISVHMGGWIVTVKVEKDGTIKSISPEFIPYYAAIKDDYKNYK